jgi:hypothetical protein
MGVTFHSPLTGDTYSGDTPDAVVTAMATKLWPDGDPAAYMLDYAERAKLWDGSEVDTFTAGHFLDSLVRLNFLQKVD